MKTIKAIVMTYDKYRTLTDHMIFKYNQLWPNNPFVFRVPYQEIPQTIQSDKVEYKKTSSDIKSTVLTLLNDLDDEELVYWCIDDKYPIKINVPRVEKIYQWLIGESSSVIDAVLFCRCRTMLLSKNLTGKKVIDTHKNVYLERKEYQQIWIHQFLKVKVLRYFFESLPDIIPQAISMDKFKETIVKPSSHGLFVTKKNLAAFGESTVGGVITLNCYRSIIDHNLNLPEWYSKTTEQEIIMGTWRENYRFRKQKLLDSWRNK